MKRRQRLGQHFLYSRAVAHTIVSEAKITRKDIVYEVGTGLGMLTRLLCMSAGRVISAEADRELFNDAKANLSQLNNLTLQFGDGFEQNNKFTVFVSNLPYSESRRAIEWLAQAKFSHGVIMVQEEFARKLLSKSEKRAVSVIANHSLDMSIISRVNRANFIPAPRVDSILLRIRQKAAVEKELIRSVKGLFSYRRKTISNILEKFGRKTAIQGRLDDLSDEEIIDLAKTII